LRTGVRNARAAAGIDSTRAEGPFFHAAKREARDDRLAPATLTESVTYTQCELFTTRGSILLRIDLLYLRIFRT
jgi:hypothetical protein